METGYQRGKIQEESMYYEHLKQRPGDFSRDFLGRILAACLFTSSDYVQASREHRALDKVAMEKLGDCTFKPGIDENGRPIGGTFDVEYVWKRLRKRP